MDEKRPPRRRELTPKEKKNLEKQRENEQRLNQRKAKEQAKQRENERRGKRRGDGANIVLDIPPKPKKRKWKKTVSDVIAQETDKRVRDLEATDHKDGYYADEVAVRKAQAEKQRKIRRAALPKQLTPKQRRRRRIITYVSIIAGVLIVGIALSLTVLFKTERIIVRGNKYYDDSQVIRFSGVHEGENIFMTTVFGNADGVPEHLPYIKSAKLSFEIPNAIVITVENEEPYYVLKSDNKYYLVSQMNRILEQVDKRPDKIMFVNAPSLKRPEVGAFVEFEKPRYTFTMNQITESLVNNGYEGVTSINIRRLSDIRIIYDNRIEIRLGKASDIDYKIRTAFTIIQTKLDPNNSGRVTGVLNVANCHSTKKSYFDPEGFRGDEETTAPTKPTTEPTTATETETETEEETYEEYYEEPDEEETDFVDLDGDGIPDDDTVEGYDSDGDGIIDDYDGDGVPDDLDGDGVPDDQYSWDEGAYDGGDNGDDGGDYDGGYDDGADENGGADDYVIDEG